MTARSYSAGPLAQLTSRCLIDDRGRRVQAVRMSRWWPPPGHVLSPDVRRRIQPSVTPWKAIRHHRWKFLVMPFGVGACNFAVLIPLYLVYSRFLQTALVRQPGASPMSAGTVVLMVGWLVVVVVVTTLISMPFGRWYWNPLIVNALLREGFCPTCGYSLADCSEEADGCRVCPECGAAWRVLNPTY